MKKAAKLVESAREAAEVRAHQTDPNVVALRIERTRALVDRLIWSGIVAGLLFTMANVQSFAAAGSKLGSIDWVIAWLLDPMVSLVLIGVLKGEQVINRAGLKTGAWVRITKWVALGCTYGMNTWSAYAAGSPAKILLHSVPPLIVVCATEAITGLRLLITKAVDTAYRLASGPPAEAPVAPPSQAPVSTPVASPAGRPPERPSTAWQASPGSPAGAPGKAPAASPVERPRKPRKAPAAKASQLSPAEVKAKMWELLKEDPEMSAPTLAVKLGKSPKSGHVRDLKNKVLEELRDAGELPSVRALGA